MWLRPYTEVTGSAPSTRAATPRAWLLGMGRPFAKLSLCVDGWRTPAPLQGASACYFD